MMSYASPDPNAFGTVISAYKLAKKAPVTDYLQDVKAAQFRSASDLLRMVVSIWTPARSIRSSAVPGHFILRKRRSRGCLQAEDLEAADRWLDTAVKLCTMTQTR